MSTLKVSDLMTTDVLSVRANEDLQGLYDLMHDYHVRHIPVVDDLQKVVGLVSHRDLVKAVLYGQENMPEKALFQMLRATRVKEIMVKNIKTVSADADLADAGQIILDKKLGCLPVTHHGQLVGIITEADFVRHVVESNRSHSKAKAG